MTELNENRGRAGGSIKSLWTADEVKLVKHFLNTFQIRQWDFPYTYVDRSDPEGEWILNVPRAAPKEGCIRVNATSLTHGADAEFALEYATNTDVLELIEQDGVDMIEAKVAGIYHVDMSVVCHVHAGVASSDVGLEIHDEADDGVETFTLGARYIEKMAGGSGEEKIPFNGSKSFDLSVGATGEKWHVLVSNADFGLSSFKWNVHLVQAYEAP